MKRYLLWNGDMDDPEPVALFDDLEEAKRECEERGRNPGLEPSELRCSGEWMSGDDDYGYYVVFDLQKLM